MSSQTVRFEQVKLKVSKRGVCRCGKRCTRQTTIWHTVNPFNRNKDGVQKSRAEVGEDVRAAAEKWKSEPIACSGCESA